LPNQTTYRTTVRAAPTGDEIVVDLKDETQVKAALFRYQMAARLPTLMQEAARQMPLGFGARQ